MKRRIVSIVIALVMCACPLTVIAEDVCYDNSIDYDEWGYPTEYGSHDWYYDYSEEPTCESEGYDYYTCAYCYMEDCEVIPATGHYWSSTSLVDSPSRYDTLIWGRVCENSDCGEVRYTPIKVKKGKKKRVISKKHLKRLKKLTNRRIRWTSSKKKVATVSNGVVKAKKKGTTYIKAKIWVKKYSTWVYIKYKVVVK